MLTNIGWLKLLSSALFININSGKTGQKNFARQAQCITYEAMHFSIFMCSAHLLQITDMMSCQYQCWATGCWEGIMIKTIVVPKNGCTARVARYHTVWSDATSLHCIWSALTLHVQCGAGALQHFWHSTGHVFISLYDSASSIRIRMRLTWLGMQY